jgi:hypothetical protein
VGEPIAVSISLVTRFQVQNGSWAELPSFDGFWAEKVFDADRFDPARTIDGKARVADRSRSCCSRSPGEAKIRPWVQHGRDAAVADHFRHDGRRAGPAVDSAIPTSPAAPEAAATEFTGSVGQFTMTPRSTTSPRRAASPELTVKPRRGNHA